MSPRDDHGYGFTCVECGSQHWTEEFERTAQGPVCPDCATYFGLREPEIEVVPEIVRARYASLREAA